MAEETSLPINEEKIQELIELDERGLLSFENKQIIIDAAHQGYVPAIKAYACHNPIKATQIVIELAKKEDVSVDILRILGTSYLKGDILEKDIEKGIGLIKKAVDKGDTKAMLKLGKLYEFGHYGISKDMPKAVEYYTLGAELGEPVCMHNLGWNIQQRDKASAMSNFVIKLYKQAIEKGEYGTYNLLGICYSEGYGVEKDIEKSIECFEKAIELGKNKEAHYNLYLAYTRAGSPCKNVIKGMEWLKKGVLAGDENCIKKLKKMKSDQ